MFWADEPISLQDLDFGKEQIDKLNDLNNYIFYGPSGSGRHTRVRALLVKWLGDHVLHTKMETKSIKIGSRTIDVNLLSSNVHTEIIPSDLGNSDRFVMQHIVKEMASTKSITDKPKVIVILDADRLSQAAQHALRRTMEVYINNLRFIFIVENIGKFISPLISRCASIRMAAPNTAVIKTICNRLCKLHQITISDDILTDLITRNRRNLRQILLDLETAHILQNSHIREVDSMTPDYILYDIKNIVNLMIKEQTPSQMVAIRPILYNLIAKCIPNDQILIELVEQLTPKLDEPCLKRIYMEAATTDERCVMGSKSIMHLEAFVAKSMVFIKQSNEMVY